jgi:hypothetical protein
MSLSRSAGAWALPALVLPLASCAPAVPPAPAPTPGAPIAAVPAANGADGFDLSVANIMRGELLVGRSPSEVRWSEDSRHVFFRWRDPESGDTATSVYRVAAAGGEPERLSAADAHATAPAAQGRWSANGERRAFERGGDIHVADRSGREWRVTDTPGRERSPHLSPDGNTVHYIAGNNLFAVPLAGGPLRQLTDLRMENRRPSALARAMRASSRSSSTNCSGWCATVRPRSATARPPIRRGWRFVRPTWGRTLPSPPPKFRRAVGSP